MRLDQAIAKVCARLASLDTERAEAETPLWAAALQDAYPQDTGQLDEPERFSCPYCNREHDSRIACPECAYGALRPGAIYVQPVPPEIRASARSDPASWPVFEGEIHYAPVQECGHTTRSFSLNEGPPLSMEYLLHERRYRETVRMPLPPERPVDMSDALPNDLALPVDEWNAKVDAVLADVAAWQQRVEEAHGHKNDGVE